MSLPLVSLMQTATGLHLANITIKIVSREAYLHNSVGGLEHGLCGLEQSVTQITTKELVIYKTKSNFH